MPLHFSLRPGDRFVALCDRFLYPGWQHNDAILFRARTLIGLLIVYQFIVVVGSLFALLFSSFPLSGNATAIAILLTIFFCFHGLMHSIARHGNLTRAAHIAVAVTFTGVEAGILVSGGPLASPALGVTVVPSVVAFCVIGRRAGVVWALISFAAQFAAILLDHVGVHFLNLIMPEQMPVHRVFNWIVVFSAVVGIVVVYETANRHLQKDRDQQMARFQHLALHDALTGLANRKQFTDRVKQALAAAARHNKLLAVVYLDLNGFKQINDALGHEAGDKVLQIVAQRLAHTVRKCDTVARLGGDEFAVLLEDISDQYDAEHTVLRLQESIALPIEAFRDFPLRGSFGIALAPTQANELDALLLMADKAMYEAKKNQVVYTVYDPSKHPIESSLAHNRKFAQAATAQDPSPRSNAATSAAFATHTKKMFAHIQQWFIAHTNAYLPTDIHGNTDQLLRARILIACLRVSQLVAAAFLLNVALLLNDLTPGVRMVIGAMLAALFVLFGLAPRYILHGGNIAVVSTLLVLCIFTSVEAGVYFTGGPWRSNTLDMSLVPPLAAFCLNGRWQGFAWASLAVVIHTIMLIAESVFGVTMPMLHQVSSNDSATLINWAVFFCCSIGVVFIFEMLNQRLQQERDGQRAQLEYLASHDMLTGVANRRRFLDELHLAVERMRRSNGTVAVAYLDLNGFKPVNDNLGHDAGDMVLKTIAQRLTENVRSMDTVARLGGDEFGIIMENVGSLDNAITIASKVQQIVSQPIEGLESQPVSSSIGIALAPLHTSDGNTLIRMADNAMFRAKSSASDIVAHGV